MRAFLAVTVGIGIVTALVISRRDPLPDESARTIAGLWSRWPDVSGDDGPVRFYFFHEDGFGLYRYGKIGLNNTHSFDWRVEGEVLELRFRKTGRTVRTPFAVGANKLYLRADPMEPLSPAQEYTFVPPPARGDVSPDLFASDEVVKDGEVPGRLWMDAKKYATGGMGFSLYQLRECGIDGRGTGWFHTGDFDDWSTEALTYRWAPRSGDGMLELRFAVRGEKHHTAALHRRGEPSTLQLASDPRGFWQTRSYADAGPSFGAALWPHLGALRPASVTE